MEHTHIAKDGTVYTHTHEEAHEHGHSQPSASRKHKGSFKPYEPCNRAYGSR